MKKQKKKLKNLLFSSVQGFSLIEIMITLIIAGIYMLSISSYLVIINRVTTQNRDNTIAISLANGLMEEILIRRWDELYDTCSVTLAPDTAELAGDKTAFDDIDDFNGYIESPPKDPLGNDLNNFSQFNLNVEVTYLTEDLVATVTPTVRKQVNIFVQKNSKVIYNISTLKVQKKGI